MPSPDEVMQTMGAIERMPLPLGRETLIDELRQEPNTDTLPSLEKEPITGEISWQQTIQAREEHKRLLWELEEQQSEIERLTAALQSSRSALEVEIEAIHSGHRRQIEQIQNQLRQAMEERNLLQQAYRTLQQQHQEFEQIDQAAIERAAQNRIMAAIATLQQSPNETPTWLNPLAQMVEARIRRAEDQSITEAHALKRELQHLMKEVEAERGELAREQQNTLALQHSIRAHARQRETLIAKRLQNRKAMAVTITAAILLFCLPIIQYFFLLFLHVPQTPSIVVALFLPLAVCLSLAPVIANRAIFVKHAYTSAPHRKVVKNAH